MSTNIRPMTKDESNQIAGRIAAEHGCEIQPGAFRRTALVVQRRYQRGDIQDRRRWVS